MQKPPGEPGQLFQTFHDRLRGFIARRVPDAEVDDILQEVFLRMHRGLPGLRDGSRIAAWLFQIARNAVHDYYRGRGRETELLERVRAGVDHGQRVALAPGADEETAAARAEVGRCLAPMIRQLAPKYRAALELVEEQGLSQTAAAERLGLTVSGVKSRVQRARARLRVMIGECCRIQQNSRNELLGCEPRQGPACGDTNGAC